MTALGIYLMLFDDGGYVMVCDVTSTPVVWLLYAWVVTTSYAAFAVYKRAPVEDGLLKEEFRETWQDYSRSTPYQFIPFVM